MSKSGRNVDTFFMDAFEGLRNVRKGHFAYFCDEPIARQVIRQLFDPYEICDTKTIPYIKTIPTAIAVKRFSPLLENLAINWMWMNEIGMVDRILRRRNSGRLTCISKTHFEGVRLEYMAPIFSSLILSYAVSLGILVVEMCSVRMADFRRRVYLTIRAPQL